MTSIILRNHRACAECATYTTNQNKLEVYQVDSPFEVNVSGKFSYLGGVLVKIFRLEESPILLEIADKRYVFENLKISTQDVERISDGFEIHQKRHITIQTNEKTIFETDYDEISLIFEFDWTPNIDDEDFDVGLFLENISKSRERQQRLWNGWKND